MARTRKQNRGVTVTDETRSLADLSLDPKNARRHTEAQVAQIARSIEQFGYVEKMVIRPTGQLIGGEGRYLALERLGWQEAECRVIAGLTEASYRKLALSLNRIGENSSWDNDTLRELLGELKEEGEDILDIGFSTGEIDKLFKEDDALEVRTVETSEVDDEFWISIRGPLKSQAEAFKRLEDALRPVAGVSVELGTINFG